MTGATGGMTDVPADRWEGVSASELRSRWGIPALHLFDAVASTNDTARRLAATGAEVGTTVLSDRQLAGRGRAGRLWDSPARAGLWLSMIAPPPSDAAAAGSLPLRIGAALAAALDPLTRPARPAIKWPNDLMLGGAKLAGILCEGSWEGSRPGPVIVGVGVNVAQRAEEFPAEVRETATSISMARGAPVARLEVAGAVVPALLDSLRRPISSDRLEAELGARDLIRGAEIVVSDPVTGEELLEGVAMGIAPDGALLVRDARGALRTVRSGTVRPRDGAYPDQPGAA